MTEEEWLSDETPVSEATRLLTQLRSQSLPGLTKRGLARKLRLFGVAECRRSWSKLKQAESRAAVDGAELYADGLIPVQRLAALRSAALAHARDSVSTPFEYAAAAIARRDFVPHWIVQLIHTGLVLDPPGGRCVEQGGEIESRRLLREIFDNPFRPAPFEARWRSSDVVGLARGIYDDRAFDRLPILADALIDAGCDDEQILAHCRSDGPHVRGCWVIDLVLGKE
jgi:hypothetical protein